jgi:hypothetical protein
MKNTLKEKDKKCAKQILIENNWFRDYYYIKKVIESCCNLELVNNREYWGSLAVQKSRKWGFNVLDRKIKMLCEKYPNFKCAIEELYYDYISELRNIYENVFEELLSNG